MPSDCSPGKRLSVRKRLTVIQEYRRLLAEAQDERDELAERLTSYTQFAQLNMTAMERALQDLIALRDASDEAKWDQKTVARLDEIYRLAGFGRSVHTDRWHRSYEQLCELAVMEQPR